ncbi:MAG TPA: enoyl-CoA hydratase/isomerase family protein [Pyrinomonadaceae bacterium]|jgi:enoyl-CoA hydratase/carnithine racemase|nr:enoyl-CoA hydratase/isomerase family protein [Pyrinomonadaceae bacterium]
MAEDSPAIVTTFAGAIAVIRFHQPAQRNPLSTSTLQHLESTLSDLLPRSDVKCLIFTGTDEVFASGANIHELSQLDSHSALEFSQLGQRIFQTIADAEQVTIAAISGFCMAARSISLSPVTFASPQRTPPSLTPELVLESLPAGVARRDFRG